MPSVVPFDVIKAKRHKKNSNSASVHCCPSPSNPREDTYEEHSKKQNSILLITIAF